jgi:diguanylate cyclase (GGDEF)-like protein
MLHVHRLLPSEQSLQAMPRYRPHQWVMGAILLAVGIYAIYLLAHPGNPAQFNFGDNAGETLLEFLAFLLAFPFGTPSIVHRWTRQEPRDRTWSREAFAPLFIALGILSYTIGQAIWTINEDVLHLKDLFPSWADVGYLGTYPLLLLGILLLPRRPLSVTTRLRVVLDSLMIVAGVVTLTWYYILGPTLIQSADSLGARLVSAAYPLASPVLIVCVLLLAAQAGDFALGKTVLPLILGLLVLTVTDSIFGYQELHGTYMTGRLLDLGWPLGFALIGLGARAAWHTPLFVPPHSSANPTPSQRHEQPSPETVLWRALLPYTFVAAVMLLSAVLQRTQSDMVLKEGVYLGVGLVMTLSLARQAVTRGENIALYRQLHGRNVALQAANARLEALASRDSLTDLWNHRAMIDACDAQIAHARDTNRPFALLFIDIDNFKALNDAFGHDTGDLVLQEFSALLAATLSEGAIIGRWGGEEFVVIIPQTAEADARASAERVRETVTRHEFSTGWEARLTCSIGLALYPHDGTTGGALVKTADQAMYAAKRRGRDRVYTIRDLTQGAESRGGNLAAR